MTARQKLRRLFLAAIADDLEAERRKRLAKKNPCQAVKLTGAKRLRGIGRYR